MKAFRLPALTVVLLVLTACQTVPITGRGGERLSQLLLVQTGRAATQVALARNDPETVQSVAALLGAGAAVGLLLPWSRSQESEADHLGLIYMAKAGYHPSAARDLWVP